MALSKKKSRPITVDDIDYRWIFFENSGWNDLTIQAASGKGGKLAIQINWEKKHSDPLPYMSITPSFVEQSIKYAHANGWQPEVNGKPFKCKFRDGSFSKVSAKK